MKNFILSILSFISASILNAQTDIETITMQNIQPVYKQKKPHGDLYTAGQPSKDSFFTLKELGIKTVLNLSSDEEIDFPEKEVVVNLKMNYVNIPVTPANLDLKTIEKFSAVLSNPENYPIFIHCSSANRAATMVALDEIITNKQPVETEIQKATQYGITKEALKEKIRQIMKTKEGDIK